MRIMHCTTDGNDCLGDADASVDETDESDRLCARHLDSSVE
jgi:hypothetical protein